MNDRSVRAWVLIALLFAGSGLALADIVSYDYDALGRLKRIRYPDGRMVVYSLDAAGNRSQVTSGTVPNAPSSMTVPSSSTTGSYALSWGAASGTVTAYKLFEATNSGFSSQVLVYSGGALSTTVSGRVDGSYYYRVQACFDDLCSGYRAGSNAVSVVLPPGVPPSLSVPANSGPSYTISWAAASGSSPSYQLYEATNSGFSGEALIFSGSALSHGVANKPAGTYYYRVRACNGSGCSGFRNGSHGVTVVWPIQPLSPTIQVPSTGLVTHITTFANMNGNAGTIHSISTSCAKAGAQIESGAQSVRWSNSNWYYRRCQVGYAEACSANFVIRNSGNGQLHSGNATVYVDAWGVNLPPNTQCP